MPIWSTGGRAYLLAILDTLHSLGQCHIGSVDCGLGLEALPLFLCMEGVKKGH